ncbi:hypothetical protein A4X13_0g2605 [Tilletia indica]|uniref:Uncharacterized protein n=1 Tax=Tilletia indica TaxID=43049 RepID=A0A8T8T8W2_9BASI|nr:hypothetical protein A4X13_0g2605 [Tilletia indica]
MSTDRAAVTLHRVRFLDWAPSPITAIAFAPLPTHLHNTTLRPVLAIARQNGNIELCQWNQNDTTSAPSSAKTATNTPPPRPWLVDSVIVNPYPANVQALCFVLSPTQNNQTLRLFSISGGAVITEHALTPSIAAIYHRHAKTQSNPGGSSIDSRPNPFAPLSPASADPRFLATSRSLPSHAGTVWSISPSPLGTKLAIGCEDGRVRLIDIAQGRFQHLDQSSPLARRRRPDGSFRGIAHTLDRAKGRIMCLAWGPPQRSNVGGTQVSANKQKGTQSDSSDDDSDDDEDDSGEVAGWTESFLLGGTSASHAVLWEVSTGQTLARLQTPTARTRSHIDGPTVVWSCAVLPDGTTVLGDSTGRVTFYDGRTRVPIPGAAFASHGQNADVLALCVGPDGKTIYSGGVDQRVAEYTLVHTSTIGGVVSGSRAGKWVQTGLRRLHAHDIRALAIEPAFDMMRVARARYDALARQGDRTAPLVGADDVLPPRLPILASGGLDYHLVLTPAVPPTSPQARDEAGRTVVSSHSDNEDDAEEDAAADLHMRSPNKRRLKGTHRLQGRAADGLDADRIAETTRLYNPISTTTLVNFADTTQRRVPFVPLNSLGAGSQGGGSLGSALAGGTVAAVLKQKRWIVLRRDRSIAVWALTGSSEEDDVGMEELGGGGPTTTNNDEHNWTKMLDLEPRLRSQIITAAMDPTGRFLAVSDLFETKLFVFAEEGGILHPAKVGSFVHAFEGLDAAPAASALTFTPDGDALILCTHRGAWIHVIRIGDDESEQDFRCVKVKSFAQHRSRPTWLDGAGIMPRAMVGRKMSAMAVMGPSTPNGSHLVGGLDTAESSSVEDVEETNGHGPNGTTTAATAAEPSTLPLRDQFVNVLHASVSADGRYLATLDDSKRVHVFSLETLSHLRVMPSLAERPSSLIWRSFGAGAGGSLWLVALLPSGMVSAWDVESASSSSPHAVSLQQDVRRWSKGVSAALVPVLSSIKDPAVGILWLPSRREIQDSLKKKKQHGTTRQAETMLVWGPNWLCTVVEREGGMSKEARAGGEDVEMEEVSTNGAHLVNSNSSSRRRRRRDSNPPSKKDDGSTATSAPLAVVPTAAASSKSEEVKEDANRFEVRLNFRYASILLVDTVEPAVVDRQQEEGEGEGGPELVVVERPFFDLVAQMAPAYNRGARYGS